MRIIWRTLVVLAIAAAVAGGIWALVSYGGIGSGIAADRPEMPALASQGPDFGDDTVGASSDAAVRIRPEGRPDHGGFAGAELFGNLAAMTMGIALVAAATWGAGRLRRRRRLQPALARSGG